MLDMTDPKYRFIDDVPNVAMLTLAGSHAYGTNVEGSDVDIRGFYLPTVEDIKLMRPKFETVEDRDTDTVLYPLSQFVYLLSNCNPNVIEMLGTRDEDIVFLTEEGKLLRDNADAFLSKRASYTFGGYARSQLRRLQNALAKDSYPQNEKEKHILDSIKNQMSHLQRTYTSFNASNVNIYISPSTKQELDTEIMIDLNLWKYPLRDLSNIVSEMNNVVREYDKLGNRNHKKDIEHLTKHAMHLLRVYATGIDILNGHGIKTFREGQTSFYRAIRNGEYSWKEIFEIVDFQDQQFEAAAACSSLPEEPDHARINSLFSEITTRVLEGRANVEVTRRSEIRFR